MIAKQESLFVTLIFHIIGHSDNFTLAIKEGHLEVLRMGSLVKNFCFSLLDWRLEGCRG